MELGLLWTVFTWATLLVPAVVMRKYRRRPMNKRQAIGASVAIIIILNAL
jgi:hypothetical protein